MIPKVGSLLIAPPSMQDKRFEKTVLLLSRFDNTGSFAICLNRPTNFNISAIGKELGLDKELPFTMHWGGPITTGSVWMVHTTDWENEQTVKINDNWNLTSSEGMFHSMADGDVPKEFRIMYGYCSWAPSQLEMELAGQHPFSKKSSWLVMNNPDPEWVFDVPINELWEASVFKAGEQIVDTWIA